ncbi:MAG: ACP S-malonyltransferase [Candidatus Omnitrophica bacterium]|nr:ACP S-malonyltransferase [Candidatus Omnitrophota bacterium]
MGKSAAFIFPGQGAQYVGMGKDLYENFAQAKEVFDTANEILGFDLKGLCFEGPMEKLATTGYSQPAILATSIAALRSLESKKLDIDIKAALGLSLGEYSALVSAGSIKFEDAIKLVRARGKFMEEATKDNPGKMASVIGLNKESVEEVCKESGCEIANLNCPGQVVISGKSDSVDKAAALAKEKGAKRSIMLDVSGPFHSSLMESASKKLEKLLSSVDISKPALSVISNVDAAYEEDPARIRENLVRQLTCRTYWADSIRLLVKEGVKNFLEIGPGKVLKGILRRIDPDLAVYNIGTVDDMKNFEGLR